MEAFSKSAICLVPGAFSYLNCLDIAKPNLQTLAQLDPERSSD
jgi:hypothetical protein